MRPLGTSSRRLFMTSFWNRVVPVVQRIVHWGDRRIPWGLRSALGLLFMVGGLFGFLPILGFWMVPTGVALIALDVPPLRHRLLLWLDRQGGRPDAE
jgi:hypothetical protein